MVPIKCCASYAAVATAVLNCDEVFVAYP
jgi:hypothetical protein